MSFGNLGLHCHSNEKKNLGVNQSDPETSSTQSQILRGLGTDDFMIHGINNPLSMSKS